MDEKLAITILQELADVAIARGLLQDLKSAARLHEAIQLIKTRLEPLADQKNSL